MSQRQPRPGDPHFRETGLPEPAPPGLDPREEPATAGAGSRDPRTEAGAMPSDGERYRVLLDIARSLSATLSLTELYRAIHRETTRVLSAPGFFISLYDEDRDLATVVFYVDRGQERESRFTYRGSRSKAIRFGRPTLVRDRRPGQSLLLIGEDDRRATRSAISAPMRHQGRVIGAISAQSYEPGAFDQHDLELLEGIADIAAIAAENARHVSELERRRWEAEKLEELGRKLTSSLDTREVLQGAIEAPLELLHAEECTVWALQEGVLRITASEGPLQLPLGEQLPLDDFARNVVEHGQSSVVGNIPGNNRLPQAFKDLLRSRSGVFVPLEAGGESLGILSVGESREDAFGQDDAVLLRRIANQAAGALQNARLHQDLQTLSMTDPLTGLPNRRHLQIHLEREVAAAHRGRELSVVVFDLDNFKGYNDTQGHPAGDHVLRRVARILAGESRAMNLVARYGGDEFVSVLSDTSEEGAREHARRVARRIQEDPQLARHGISVSFGTASFAAGTENAETLLQAADRAMFHQKQRNRRPS